MTEAAHARRASVLDARIRRLEQEREALTITLRGNCAYCGRGPTRMSYGAQVCRAHHRLPLVDPFYGGEL